MKLISIASGVKAMLFCLCPIAFGQTQITTVEEFMAISNNETTLNGDYILMNDLTLDNWIPIGIYVDKNENGFSGTFNGNGHTVSINSFGNSSNDSKMGLFGVIEKTGIVKNIRVAGNVSHTGSSKFLYLGGITGVNYGLITGCISKIELEGSVIHDKDNSEKKLKNISGYELGAIGGCIAGINRGIITNSYSTGSITSEFYGGGIAGGNGQPVLGGIGISIGPGGGGVSVTPGVAVVSDIISYCYSTATVISSMSGGITAFNHPTANIYNSVAMNKLIEAKGIIAKASHVASIGLTYYRSPNTYYLEDIVVRIYKKGKEETLKKKPKNGIALSVTQEESWWHLPENVSKKDQYTTFGFAFGNEEQSPWVWNSTEKYPILYWEKI